MNEPLVDIEIQTKKWPTAVEIFNHPMKSSADSLQLEKLTPVSELEHIEENIAT